MEAELEVEYFLKRTLIIEKGGKKPCQRWEFVPNV
jgi:hypothetical protein